MIGVNAVERGSGGDRIDEEEALAFPVHTAMVNHQFDALEGIRRIQAIRDAVCLQKTPVIGVQGLLVPTRINDPNVTYLKVDEELLCIVTFFHVMLHAVFMTLNEELQQNVKRGNAGDEPGLYDDTSASGTGDE